MSIEHAKIRRYQYEFHSQFTDAGANDHVLLYLYDDDDTLAAVLAFVDEARTLAPPTEHVGGHVALEMHARHLQPMIDMLRNEKPVVVSWSKASGVVRVSTQQEPVGEQELKRMFSFLYI